ERGIILMNLWFNIPFVTLLILAGLSAIRNASIEAAKDIGASKWQIFLKVILPNTYKDIVVAMTFVFMGNVGSFTTPFLMGGNHPKMLGIALYDQFNSYMDYERTSALSVIMFLICSVSAVVYIVTNLKKEQARR
ncbi:TPA: ABC transporter permease subunit, partial [Enterococcus faecium]|nr:ABC transporter permease subunit [Enterococcus faecium]HAZ0960900.1 ABC transporter permease subunit [Enterococcus faecium]